MSPRPTFRPARRPGERRRRARRGAPAPRLRGSRGTARPPPPRPAPVRRAGSSRAPGGRGRRAGMAPGPARAIGPTRATGARRTGWNPPARHPSRIAPPSIRSEASTPHLDSGLATHLTWSMPPAPDAYAADNAVLFGRLLRRAGLAVDPDRARMFLRAMLLLGLDRKGDIKAAGRALFVRRREERATYDTAFELFWRRRVDGAGIGRQLPKLKQGEQREAGVDLGGESGGDAIEIVTPVSVRAPSAREELRNADFAALTPDEARDAQAMLAALRPRLPRRRSRRSAL